MSGRLLGSTWAAVAFVLDQGSKALALGSPSLAAGTEVLPVFNLVLIRNDGVSFGMLSGLAPRWTLVLLALTVVVWLSVWLWRSQSRQVSVALGLIIGGALGNVADRIRFHAVTDFLDFHLGTYHWPAFNLADVAVVSGVAMLAWNSFRDTKETSSAKT